MLGSGLAISPPFGAALIPDLADFPLVKSYDLGMASLTQTDVDKAFETMPLALTGAIALPPDNFPVPWIVILHGRHAGCHFNPDATSQWPCDPEPRFDLGFAYLAQALAEVGYGVIIPNLNAAFSETYGATADNRNELADQRSGQIINAHLTRLAQADRGDDPGFGLSLTGRIDLTRLAMIGHSMGGGAATLSAIQRLHINSAASLQAKIAGGLGPIAALVLVSPTRSYAIAQRPDAYQLPDVPTAVIAGGCDRDIFDLSSLYYAETARQQPRTSPVLGILLPGANHHYFSAAVEEDDYYRQPNNGQLCNPQRSRDRLSRVAQENFLAQYTTAFLQTVWATPGDDLALAQVGLAAHRAAPAEIFGQSVLTTLVAPATQRHTVFHAKAAPVATLTAGLEAKFCQALTACDGSPRPYPHFPDLLTLEWSAIPQQLQVPLENTNASDFASLELRLAPDPSWPVAQGQPVFAVVLHDQQGGAARVEIPSMVPALRQFEPDPNHGNTAPLYPSSLRIPLGQFAGVNLAALTSMELVFDQATQGRLHLASIEFLGR
jgi:pimeloyl-ACP methyl ester carboxylesterase